MIHPNFSAFAVFKEASQPTTPASGYVMLYAKNDKSMYVLNSDGVETVLGSGGGGGGGTTYTAGSGLTLVGTQFNIWGGSGNFVDITTNKVTVSGQAVASGLVTNNIQFSGGAPTAGFMTWDDGEGTASLTLKGGNILLEVGQENVVRCYNGLGSGLFAGQVVYISGVQGQRPSLALASNDSEARSSKTLGIVAENITDGQEGFVATFGVVPNINTQAFAAGSTLWLGVSGAMTTTKPVAPSHGVFLGYSLKQNASSGRVFINSHNGYELEEIHNVLINGVTSGNILQYDGSLWKNVPSTGVDVYINASLDNTTSGTFYPVFVSASGTNSAPKISTQFTFNPGTDVLAVSGSVNVVGQLSATTKSFLIDHPVQDGKKLQYGSLESPYHGIRLTGMDHIVSGKCIVQLPDYTCALVHDDVNVQLTPIGRNFLWVEGHDLSANSFTAGADADGPFYWSFTAVRKDIAKLEVEPWA